ncbi:ARM repeat-containing protein [Ramicandelaber brevisporus]|nr:ARM repeat-containing protein [Ramicandelaber brevisporus]
MATMRGLTVFIADLRKCKARELEERRINKELANIRTKFRSGSSLSGYDRKKYICKLLYMFILGYEVDFGHHEIINLLHSPKFSEKQIGYLAATLLLSSLDKSDFLRQIIGAMLKLSKLGICAVIARARS